MTYRNGHTVTVLWKDEQGSATTREALLRQFDETIRGQGQMVVALSSPLRLVAQTG